MFHSGFVSESNHVFLENRCLIDVLASTSHVGFGTLYSICDSREFSKVTKIC